MNQSRSLIIPIVIVLALLAIAAFGMPYSSTSRSLQSSNFAQDFQGTAIITPAGRGYAVSNVTIINPFSFILNKTYFSLHVSYITPNSTGLVVNNSVYVLYLNRPVLIRNSSNYSFYANLTNVNYYSKLVHNASIYFYSVRRPPLPLVDYTYKLSKNTPLKIGLTRAASITLNSTQSKSVVLDVMNVTNSTTAPKNYTPLLVLNISLSSPSNVTMSLSINYSCGLKPDGVVPFKLVNGTWVKIGTYARNISACNISFNIPGDPVAGLFYKNIPLTTSIAPTTSMNTTSPNQAQQHGLSSDQIAAIIIAIIVVIIGIVIYLASRSGKEHKGDKAEQPKSS